MLVLEQTSEVKFYIQGLAEIYDNSAYDTSHGKATVKWNLTVEQQEDGSVSLSVIVPEQIIDVVVEIWDADTDVNYDEHFGIEVKENEVVVQRADKDLVSDFNLKPYSFSWYRHTKIKEFIID